LKRRGVKLLASKCIIGYLSAGQVLDNDTLDCVHFICEGSFTLYSAPSKGVDMNNTNTSLQTSVTDGSERRYKLNSHNWKASKPYCTNLGKLKVGDFFGERYECRVPLETKPFPVYDWFALTFRFDHQSWLRAVAL
jgi:hypothetical protein